MKLALAALVLGALTWTASAQVWKTLPKGVRIVGYRNVTTSKINSNFNQYGSQANMGASFRIDGATLNNMTNNSLGASTGLDPATFNNLLVGEYKVDAQAQAQVHGTGFGYGITDRVMFYGEIAYYQAQVHTNIKRTSGNNYAQTAQQFDNQPGYTNSVAAENLRHMVDADEHTIQNVITNYYGYKPIGDWYGSGYGDMETGLMAKLIEKNTWGLLWYPGIVAPTGRQDDPDILQDMGFGDGQWDLFSEMATGYIVNDKLAFGTTFRYTYQAPTTKTLRVPTSRDFTLSPTKGKFGVKYGDRVNWMVNSTYYVNDWISFTPVYRFMYQKSSQYTSDFGPANGYLAYNSDKIQHEVQLTTTFSSITPFLKKNFILPAQVNINLVETVAGKNVPKMGRFEIEFRMLF